jgi:hypothetical protein
MAAALACRPRNFVNLRFMKFLGFWSSPLFRITSLVFTNPRTLRPKGPAAARLGSQGCPLNLLPCRYPLADQGALAPQREYVVIRCYCHLDHLKNLFLVFKKCRAAFDSEFASTYLFKKQGSLRFAFTSSHGFNISRALIGSELTSSMTLNLLLVLVLFLVGFCFYLSLIRLESLLLFIVFFVGLQ